MNLKKRSTFYFILIEVILYVTFLVIDFSHGSSELSSYLKYVSIIICLCMATYCNRFLYKNKENELLNLAFLGTVCADYFLLFTNQYQWGILSFLFVQLAYSIRIAIIDQRYHTIKKRMIYRIIFCLIVAVGVILNIKIAREDLLEVVLSILYFSNFVMNIIELIIIAIMKKLIYSSQSFQLFFIGMLLFLMCDIFVGLYNLSDFVQLKEQTAHIIDILSRNLMWLFYLPGQVFIVISAKRSTAKTVELFEKNN